MKRKYSFEIIDSKIDESANIYEGARVKSSTLQENTIVGNFSRVDYCTLERNCRIDRNNHLFHVSIGRYSYTGMNTVIMHTSIGNFCSISWNVSIGGANHNYNNTAQHSFIYNHYDQLRPNNKDIPYDRFTEPLKIGHDVWIAAGAIITRGVTIGNGAVIGANAVVTKDVPDYAIVTGVPGKVIKYRFEKKIIDRLNEIKWWYWSEEKIKNNFEFLSSKPNTKFIFREDF